MFCTISGGTPPYTICFAQGELVSVQIGIGAGSEVVFGGQFLLNYATDCLDFLDMDACPSTTFDWVIEYEVDEAAGTIWYAVTVDPAAPVGTPGPEDILCIDFKHIGDCPGCTPAVSFDNVNPRNTIDILDACIYLATIAGNFPGHGTAPGPNTDCGTAGPHADINADGVVDSADWTFILENFLAASKDACCPAEGAAAAIEEPILSITTKELIERGMGELLSADINGDGVLDMADLDAYMNGEMPTPLFNNSTKQRGTKAGR